MPYKKFFILLIFYFVFYLHNIFAHPQISYTPNKPKVKIKQDIIFMRNNAVLEGKVVTPKFDVITPHSEILVETCSIARIRFGDGNDIDFVITRSGNDIKGIIRNSRVIIQKKNSQIANNFATNLIRTIRFEKSYNCDIFNRKIVEQNTQRTQRTQRTQISNLESSISKTFCPSDMVEVKKEFCIDKFKYPNLKGINPLLQVSWYDAKVKCEKTGKRLCTVQEWKWACNGLKSINENYNKIHHSYNQIKCLTSLLSFFMQDNTLGISNGVSPACRNGLGVYDQIIGAAEWLNDTFNKDGIEYKFIAAPSVEQYDEIVSPCDKVVIAEPSEKLFFYGFRCCK